MLETNNKAILETLERLRRNSDFQYLCTHLKWIQGILEGQIFSDAVEHWKKEQLITKRNSIQNFIELPEDLIEQFKPTEELGNDETENTLDPLNNPETMSPWNI